MRRLIAVMAAVFTTLFLLGACWQTEPRPNDEVADVTLTSEELTVQFIDEYGLEVAATTARQPDGAISMEVLAGCRGTVVYDGTTATLEALDGYNGFVELEPDAAHQKVAGLCEFPADFGKG